MNSILPKGIGGKYQTLKVIDKYDILVKMKTMEREAELQRERAEIIERNNRVEEAAGASGVFIHDEPRNQDTAQCHHYDYQHDVGRA